METTGSFRRQFENVWASRAQLAFVTLGLYTPHRNVELVYRILLAARYESSRSATAAIEPACRSPADQEDLERTLSTREVKAMSLREEESSRE